MNSSYKEKYLGCMIEQKYKSISYKQWIQENKEKKMLEICFSYGNDMIRLQGDSRHTQDVNLHIITQGYEEGERLDLTLEFQGKAYQTTATIRDNQAIILNVFNES